VGAILRRLRQARQRNAWAPLNLARYLLEKKDALDPAWREHAKALIEFVNKRFISMHFGVAVCGEQDYDKNPWGGILANWGGVLAMYTGATGSPEYKLAAWQALTIGMYAVEDDGCPRQSITHKTARRLAGGRTHRPHTLPDRRHARRVRVGSLMDPRPRLFIIGATRFCGRTPCRTGFRTMERLRRRSVRLIDSEIAMDVRQSGERRVPRSIACVRKWWCAGCHGGHSTAANGSRSWLSRSTRTELSSSRAAARVAARA
jgi:hypothetical protein